jgi:hypothetical protein
MILDDLSNDKIIIFMIVGSFILAALILIYVPELIGTQEVTNTVIEGSINPTNYSNLFK